MNPPVRLFCIAVFFRFFIDGWSGHLWTWAGYAIDGWMDG